MNDRECIGFLQEIAPLLKYRWQGFRKVRNQVCKRIRRRINRLRLPDIEAYRLYLQHHIDEWKILDSLLYISISRFFRDPQIYRIILNQLLPLIVKSAVGQDRKTIRALSIGCCSGEEPYSLNLLWHCSLQQAIRPEITLDILATDFRSQLLERARQARYSSGSLNYLPETYLKNAFIHKEELYQLQDKYLKNVRFTEQDIREKIPSGNFDLILCRNIVFTYFEESLQSRILNDLLGMLDDGGFLILGAHEELPEKSERLTPFNNSQLIFRKIPG